MGRARGQTELERFLRSEPDRDERAALSPDLRTLALADGGGVSLWNVRAQTRTARLPLPVGASTVTGLAFDPEGKTLAIAARDGTVRLWRAGTGAPPGRPLDAGTRSANAVAFSPDGSTLAVGTNAAVRLVDVHARKGVATLNGSAGRRRQRCILHGRRVRSPPPGTTATSCSGTSRSVRRSAGRVHTQRRQVDGHDEGCSGVAFSPDGHTLAASGDAAQPVQLWDGRTSARIGYALDTRDISSFSVFDPAFSPDGRTLAAPGEDGSVLLWDVRTRTRLGQPLATGAMAPRGGTRVAFSPDGRTVAIVSDDGRVRLWEEFLWHDRPELHGHGVLARGREPHPG